MKVIVTGGSSGVGAALTRILVSKGHHVFITGRDAAAMEKLAAECNANKGGEAGKLHYAQGDVSDATVVSDHFSQALSHFGGSCDALVANAGCSVKRGKLEDCSEDGYDRVMNTNVKGVFLWLQRVVPHFRERNAGQVVVTSSVCGVRFTPTHAVYTASKFAVEVCKVTFGE
ncbi:hypothetical protein PTSG_07924 [Salpingoeca rosetta]|uniref:Uncharacterized protein n=1 Tax=Salpingoeca rosetta (strain ATCC 50818 / BSB-021) TaxID=946362 RepID=F2UGQ6_SALR5|nr:uncharacterized protein PTSG_07924 [Salpingoeca rosetta]EGD75806.1 hypothetical protein PTSG_07924 [Salpingoeca rosetta]|eukprot:XP_004991727.1 hypothetical protein PTSG_07924 [Salpingoeca rosetta]